MPWECRFLGLFFKDWKMEEGSRFQGRKFTNLLSSSWKKFAMLDSLVKLFGWVNKGSKKSRKIAKKSQKKQKITIF
jgi:hypothetical protein